MVIIYGVTVYRSFNYICTLCANHDDVACQIHEQNSISCRDVVILFYLIQIKVFCRMLIGLDIRNHGRCRSKGREFDSHHQLCLETLRKLFTSLQSTPVHPAVLDSIGNKKFYLSCKQKLVRVITSLCRVFSILPKPWSSTKTF